MTTPSPNPANSQTEVVLRDGRLARIRPARADDGERIEGLFKRMSPRSRYLRFHHARKQLTREELASITAGTAPQQRAYLATSGMDDDEQAIAMGGWYLQPGGNEAEVAFMVEDTIQVKGIGTALLELLAEAAIHSGIKRFVAEVLAENAPMLQVFEDSGFKTTRRAHPDGYTVTLNLEERAEFDERHARREHIARSAGLRRLLYPKNVAVIGASRDPRSIGGALFRNLLQAGFTGTIFPVNPNAPSVFGVLAYRSILEVPGEVDLAVLVVPAEAALQAVEECGKKGVYGLLVITAGFGEAGPEGRQRERMLREKALGYGMRIIGPNCLGIQNNDPDVRLDATFSPVKAPPGNVSVGSQSGAVGLAVLDFASGMGLGVASFVSLGNRVDISSNDLLELWEDDPKTDVILLYLESFGNPRKFSRIARRVSRKKPVIAVKAGKSAVGAKAAASHTGALAASDVAVDALFEQAGVIRVSSMEEMFHTAKLLAHQPAPKGPRVGILTNAGGLGVLGADACEAFGLQAAPLAEATQAALKALLPAGASVANPVDAIAAVRPEQYERALGLILEDANVDAVIAMYIPPLVTRADEIAGAILRAQAVYTGEKPLVACFTMADEKVDLRRPKGRSIPSFTFPEDAVQALARAYQYHRYRNEPAGHVPQRPNVDVDRVRAMLRPPPDPTSAGRHNDAPDPVGAGSPRPPGVGPVWLLPERALALLKEYGIPIAETRAAFSPVEAAAQAKHIGFPVAMKVRSSSISHKTDVGGIVLSLASEADVRAAYGGMALRMEQAGLGGRMEGVVVQGMVKGGQEVIVGMTQDPLFGPLVMVGTGGVMVELLKDVAFALHPLRDLDPERMLARLKGLPLLQGWRGSPPRDIDALKDVLLRFSALIDDLPEIDQMEINPLMVLNRGQGCVAVDARIMLRG